MGGGITMLSFTKAWASKRRRAALLASADWKEAGEPWPVAAVSAVPGTGGGRLASLAPETGSNPGTRQDQCGLEFRVCDHLKEMDLQQLCRLIGPLFSLERLT